MNFRDVGEALCLWYDPSPVLEARLFRGGKLEHGVQPADIGDPRTVLNLRRGPDPELRYAKVLQVPADNTLENYATEQRPVRQWLHRCLSVLADPSTEWPVYVHCTSGRDRTGVVVAAALRLLDVPEDVIVGEYALSDGADESAIRRALQGIAAHPAEFLGVVDGIRRALGAGG